MTAFLSLLEERLFPALAQRQTQMPVVPEGARSSTLNLNSLHGGEPEHFEGMPSPCVPDSCRIVLDRRFLIEEPLEAVKAEVLELLDELVHTRPGFRYQIRDVMEFVPTMTEKDALVVQAVASGIRAVLGKEPEYVISPGTYDQKHVVRIGHLQECIAYGPGILDLAHQPDEYVVIDDLVNSAKVMAHATLSLLGIA